MNRLPLHPLVSAVMPTADRREFLPGAITSFLAQDYEPKELVILDDGEDEVRDLVPEDPRVRYVRSEEKMNIPQKRNRLAELARGEVICHFDDDDWSGSRRISDQVSRLRQFNCGITGYHSMLFWNEVEGTAWQYRGIKNYAVGTSLCYRKAFIRRWRFAESKAIGEDNDLVIRAAVAMALVSIDAGAIMVARVHKRNTSVKNPRGESYRPMPVEAIPKEFFQ